MIAALLLVLTAAQDVPAPPSAAGTNIAKPARDADGTQRWSILTPTCAGKEGEIVVCGATADLSEPRLPLPGERGPPDRPMPSNRDVTGSGALAATYAPCATRSQGCTTGVDVFGMGTFLVRALGKVIDKDSCCEEPGEATNIGFLIRDTVKGAKKIGRKKPDKSNRVPILLDDPAPVAKAAPTP